MLGERVVNNEHFDLKPLKTLKARLPAFDVNDVITKCGDPMKSANLFFFLF